MSKEDNKHIEIFKEEVNKEQSEYENVNEYTKFFYNNHKIILNIINKQQKEKEELEFKLLARERGEAELETLIDQLKEEIDKKDKVIELIIDDFQAEGYFKEMTYEQVKKYYDNRNELKQEINTLPLNLDLTSEMEDK